MFSYPRVFEELTPHMVIRNLLQMVPIRCQGCPKPATRRAKLVLVVGDLFFCDQCEPKNLPVSSYEDLGGASVLRQAYKWLDENKIEEKT